MSKLALLDDFVSFLQEELLLDKDEINAQSTFRSLRTWSSLNALIVISRIHEETDVLISASDLAKCSTVEEIHQLVFA